MDISELRDLALKLPYVTEDIKWENHLCFSVGGKMFIVTAPDEVPVSASFKVREEDFAELSLRENCKPAPYLARYKWIFTSDIRSFGKKEWERLLKSAYEEVFKKVPGSIKKKLKNEV